MAGRNLVFCCSRRAHDPRLMTCLPNFVLGPRPGPDLNTFAGLVLPGALFSAFSIFFLGSCLRRGLPSEIEGSALIDGLGPFMMLFRIIPCRMGRAAGHAVPVELSSTAWTPTSGH